ncbi:MAG TPA: hypothetical protein VED43_00810, partial [Mycobacterium sp.]|nr:hypothetical protein [Mycobacterium sp.]
TTGESNAIGTRIVVIMPDRGRTEERNASGRVPAGLLATKPVPGEKCSMRITFERYRVSNVNSEL